MTQSLYDITSNILINQKDIQLSQRMGAHVGNTAIITYTPQLNKNDYPISHPVNMLLQFAGQDLELSIDNHTTLNYLLKDLIAYTNQHSEYLPVFRQIEGNFVKLCRAGVDSVNQVENSQLQFTHPHVLIRFHYDPKLDHLIKSLHIICLYVDTLVKCLFNALRGKKPDADNKKPSLKEPHYDKPKKTYYVSAGMDVYGKVIGYNKQRVWIKDAGQETFSFPRSSVKMGDKNKKASEERIKADQNDTSPRPYLLKTKQTKEPSWEAQKEKYKRLTETVDPFK